MPVLPLQLLRTDTPTFDALVESRRNRRDDFYKRPAGHIDLCNVPLPTRTPPAVIARRSSTRLPWFPRVRSAAHWPACQS